MFSIRRFRWAIDRIPFIILFSWAIYYALEHELMWAWIMLAGYPLLAFLYWCFMMITAILVMSDNSKKNDRSVKEIEQDIEEAEFYSDLASRGVIIMLNILTVFCGFVVLLVLLGD